MKKFIFLSASSLVLAFLYYFFLFISLDTTAIFMESDDDINKTGRTVLFVIPLVIVIGLWLASRTHNALQNRRGISRLDIAFLSLYSGLFGMVIYNLLAKLFLAYENETTMFIPILLVSFIMSMVITLILSTKHLTKISARARKKTCAG